MALTDSPPTTSNYSITLPEVGKDKNSWGGKLNSALQSIENEVYTQGQVLGDPLDSVTPSVAYQLTNNAVSDASNAAADANTAVSVAVQIVNQYLVAVVSAINTLDTEVGDTSTAGTVAYNADQAKSDAASAKTTAESLI